jgi:hypothetical protein
MSDEKRLLEHATYRASPHHGREPIEAVLRIALAIPKWTDDRWQTEQPALFDREAKAIADLLQGSLPGGLLDQLIAELMRRSASRLSVAYPMEPVP